MDEGHRIARAIQDPLMFVRAEGAVRAQAEKPSVSRQPHIPWLSWALSLETRSRPPRKPPAVAVRAPTCVWRQRGSGGRDTPLRPPQQSLASFRREVVVTRYSDRPS